MSSKHSKGRAKEARPKPARSRQQFGRLRLAVAGVATTALVAGGLTALPQIISAFAPSSRTVPLRQPESVVPAGTYGGATSATAPKLTKEIVADRTVTSSTWETGDGGLAIREYAVPHYYQPSAGSALVPIKTALQRDGDWWRSTGNSVAVSFGPLEAAGGNEQLTIGGHLAIGFSCML